MLKRIIRIRPIPPTTTNHILVMLKNLYKRSGDRTFSNTNNIYQHTNQYPTDVFNGYRINKTHNVKKTCYNSNNDVFINKHSTINTNGTYNITKHVDLYNVTDNNYYTKNQ